MTLNGRRFSIFSFSLLAMAMSTLISGCGIGTSSSSSGYSANISGLVHGGENPVSNANVILWETSTAGVTHAAQGTTSAGKVSSSDYGTSAQALAVTTTDGSGNFSFVAGSYTCDAGEYAYITATGGQAANAGNVESIQMAALGSCATVLDGVTADESNVRIFMSEVSTVAAGYALGNFISIVDAGDGKQTVNVGAPAHNASTAPACTGTGSGMSCLAGGLGHAFANAANLVTPVNTNNGGTTAATYPSGLANTVAVSNPNSSVPQALIHLIGNILESCVNSNGGKAGDGSTCGNLFNYTTAGGITPKNTLQAVINMAHYPTQNVTSLTGLSPSIGAAFQPTLSSTKDFSMAIVYTGVKVGSTTTAFGTVYPLALDAGDNVYEVSFLTPNLILTGLGANGSSLFATTNTTYTYPRFLSTDAVGNIFVANNRETAALSVVLEYSTGGTLENTISTGATTCYPYGTAADSFNNVYVACEAAAAASKIYIIPAGSTSSTTPALATAGGNAFSATAYAYDVAVDPSGDVWNVSNAANAASEAISSTLINNSSTSTPSFTTTPATTTATGTLTDNYSVVFDSAGNGWVNSTKTLFTVPVTPGPTVTVASAPSASLPITNGTVTATSTEFSSTDGANAFYLPDYAAANSYLWQYNYGAGTFVAIQPCLAPSGATTCNSGTTAGTYAALYNPIGTAVDSTGSVWVSSYTNKSIVQVIGLATPAWPQLSYGHPGQKPE